MSIGNKEVYPHSIQCDVYTGLTYREWLIGMLASNPQVVSFLDTATYEQNIEVNTKAIFDSADAIIKEMEK